jgi:hemolysin activation/secretion protein
MKLRLMAACIALGWGCGMALAQDQKFDIERFDIRGSTLLQPGEAESLVAPFTGKGRVYGDVQKALEALENAYRAKGYGTVNVHVPEQEITTGVIRLDVIEAVIGKVTVSGNRHFDTANIRASIPQLREGTAPNLRQISENVQLANENPANKVDAKIEVSDQDPKRFIVTLDNSGTRATGRHRLGVAWQNANLLGGDEMLTASYTASPDVWLGHPKGVKVNVFSVAFRKPFYGLGDSLDVIYGNSSVNVPSTAIALGSPYGIVGKGEVLSVRWNHLFPRLGEYSARLVFGYDYKYINATCDPDRRGVVNSCTPYTLQPASATYSGQWQGIGRQTGYNVGLIWNVLPTGVDYPTASGKKDRYSFIAGRPVADDFTILRYGASHTHLVFGWQLRATINGQYARSGLPSAEQLGLTGASAVRGFDERIATSDRGYVVNLEAYTPNLADKVGVPGALHGVLFYDMASGRNVGANGTPFNKARLSSIGIGLRYSMSRDLSFSVDAADILDRGPNDLDRRNGWGGHFRLMVAF